MSRARREYINGLFGCGAACAFFGAAFGIDEPGQFILFAFGFAWGGLGTQPSPIATGDPV